MIQLSQNSHLNEDFLLVFIDKRTFLDGFHGSLKFWTFEGHFVHCAVATSAKLFHYPVVFCEVLALQLDEWTPVYWYLDLLRNWLPFLYLLGGLWPFFRLFLNVLDNDQPVPLVSINDVDFLLYDVGVLLFSLEYLTVPAMRRLLKHRLPNRFWLIHNESHAGRQSCVSLELWPSLPSFIVVAFARQLDGVTRLDSLLILLLAVWLDLDALWRAPASFAVPHSV